MIRGDQLKDIIDRFNLSIANEIEQESLEKGSERAEEAMQERRDLGGGEKAEE